MQRSHFKGTDPHINKKNGKIADKKLPIFGDGSGARDLMPQEGGLAVLGTIDMGLDSSCAMVLDDDMGGIVDLRDSVEFLLLLLLQLLLVLLLIVGRGIGRSGSRVAHSLSN